MKKLCPMKFADTNGDTWTRDEDDKSFAPSTYPTCDEAKCAWWNHQTGSCAVATLALKVGWQIKMEE